MVDFKDYKKAVLGQILQDVEPRAEILAAWEGGSAANGTADQYSDIDLCILSEAPPRQILDQVEIALKDFKVVHTWQPNKSFFGEGLLQRVIVLQDAPKYFSVDVGVFDIAYPQLLEEFLEVERHGRPIIFFDKRGLIKIDHTDSLALFESHQSRVDDLNRGFPIFKTLALKEIERGHAIDALGFYQTGLVRPLIEVLGMIYRPFKSDFGMRYIHKDLPLDKQKLIEELSYVSSFKDLPKKISMAEAAFADAVQKVKSKSTL
jgi:hypothetical protein